MLGGVSVGEKVGGAGGGATVRVDRAELEARELEKHGKSFFQPIFCPTPYSILVSPNFLLTSLFNIVIIQNVYRNIFKTPKNV